MEYSNFFRNRVRAQGRVQLSLEQFSALFNLVHFEAQREAFKLANQIAAQTESAHKYDIQIYEVDQLIRKITDGKSADEYISSLLEKDHS
ncbi:MAG: hypothetical protein NXI10_03500 [bacterium]|nr:hypothetical protein [bacterium]